jgi:hypothetical protein
MFKSPLRYKTLYPTGRVLAQAVGRRLPAAAARVRAQVISCKICGGENPKKLKK